MITAATDLFGYSREDAAIARLREFEPEDGYYVAFSGGKDSVVILDLAKRAGVKFDAHHSLTTIDPPELVQFVKTFHEVVIHRPPKPLLTVLAEGQGFPIRTRRWCCEYLKEGGGDGRTVVTGVRWEESARRKAQRRTVEYCVKTGSTTVNPIVEWSNEDVWEYIRRHGLRYCSLYDEGFKRLGCVLCPMATRVLTEIQMKRWPKIAEAWRRAFNRLYDLRKQQGNDSVDRWASGNEMFEWWLTRERGVDDTGTEYMF